MTRAVMSSAHSYREVALATDVLSSQGAGLTAILYEHLIDALHLASRTGGPQSEGGRALAILTGLQGMLADSEGDSFSANGALHARAAHHVAIGIEENDPKRFQAAIAVIEPVAEVWSSLRGRL